MAYQKEGKSTRKVLVIGDIMLDKYVIGRVRRMCRKLPYRSLNVQKPGVTGGQLM